jgi:hypothetical protein
MSQAQHHSLPPIGNPESKHKRKDKLERMRRHKHVTTIQKHWRGMKGRREFKSIAHKTRKNREDCGVEEGDSKSSTNSALENTRIQPIEQTLLMKNDNLNSNDQAIEEKSSTTTINENLDSNKEIHVAQNIITSNWPQPVLENFEVINQESGKWPSLENSDPSSLDWVLTKKKVLIRAITWNMCARRPPSLSHLQTQLLPLNRLT